MNLNNDCIDQTLSLSLELSKTEVEEVSAKSVLSIDLNDFPKLISQLTARFSMILEKISLMKDFLFEIRKTEWSETYRNEKNEIFARCKPDEQIELLKEFLTKEEFYRAKDFANAKFVEKLLNDSEEK